jgi:hypothetical protein
MHRVSPSTSWSPCTSCLGGRHPRTVLGSAPCEYVGRPKRNGDLGQALPNVLRYASRSRSDPSWSHLKRSAGQLEKLPCPAWSARGLFSTVTTGKRKVRIVEEQSKWARERERHRTGRGGGEGRSHTRHNPESACLLLREISFQLAGHGMQAPTLRRLEQAALALHRGACMGRHRGRGGARCAGRRPAADTNDGD